MKKIDKIEIDEQYLLSALAGIQMFSYLNEAEKHEVLNFSDILIYEKNEKIISEGDINPYLYAIVEGTVDVCKEVKGKYQIISNIKNGDVFGEAGIFINMKRTANVIASGKVQIIRMERKNLFRFFKTHSEAGVRMLMIMTYSLLNKLKEVHEEITVDGKSVVSREYLDEIMKDADTKS